MDDEQTLTHGGHATLKGALGAYRRRLEDGNRVLAGRGFPIRLPKPVSDLDAPKPAPDYGGGQRGRTEEDRPPDMNDLLRAALGGNRASALSRWRRR